MKPAVDGKADERRRFGGVDRTCECPRAIKFDGYMIVCKSCGSVYRTPTPVAA